MGAQDGVRKIVEDGGLAYHTAEADDGGGVEKRKRRAFRAAASVSRTLGKKRRNKTTPERMPATRARPVHNSGCWTVKTRRES